MVACYIVIYVHEAKYLNFSSEMRLCRNFIRPIWNIFQIFTSVQFYIFLKIMILIKDD